jgi:hypothetical protein
MGRVERWRAHGRVRWHIPGFRRGPQSGSPGDVSSTLPKIPDGGFSPVRLQAEASFNQQLPCPEDLRAQAPGPHTLARLAVRQRLRRLWTLLRLRPAFSTGPALGHFGNHPGPRVLCSERFCCPFPPRYYDPIRQSRSLPLPSQDHWLCRRPLPYDLVWAATETFPALGQCSFPHVPSPLRREEKQVPFPDKGLLPWPSSLEQ